MKNKLQTLVTIPSGCIKMEELTQEIRIKEPCFEVKINRLSRPPPRGPLPHPDGTLTFNEGSGLRRIQRPHRSAAPVGLVDLLRHSLANTSVTANILEAPVRQPGPLSRSLRPASRLDFLLLPQA